MNGVMFRSVGLVLVSLPLDLIIRLRVYRGFLLSDDSPPLVPLVGLGPTVILLLSHFTIRVSHAITRGFLQGRLNITERSRGNDYSGGLTFARKPHSDGSRGVGAQSRGIGSNR